MSRPLDRVPTWGLALLGMALVFASGMRWGVAPLAWVAPVPWLLWVRRAEGARGRLAILLALVVASVAQVAKIITPPIPMVFALGFGIPMAVGTWGGLLAWDALRRRTLESVALYVWPALTVLAEWASAAGGPMGVWGTGASTQADNLELLQIASVLGVTAIGGLMAWVASFLAAVIAAPERRWVGHGLALAAVLTAVFAFGVWRLGQPSRGPTVRVAAVVTDLGLAPGAIPGPSELDANLDTLFERSARAAERGARVIAWNEGASIVEREDEAAVLARASTFARTHGVDLLLAYIVPTSRDPFHFENLAVFLDDQGQVRARYYKRHPVPGETEPSDNPVPRIPRPYGVVSLAICYDHDFPEMSRGHARVGADLVLLPSSDWAGIDPLHTELARVRAIEGGFASLRPTRWASSAAFDAVGRVRGWMSVTEDNDRVLLAELPAARRPTIYARVGDVPMLTLAGVVLVGAGWLALRHRLSSP